MSYLEEYNDCIKQFAQLKKDLTTPSGDVASKRIMEIEGMNFRIAEIIANLEVEKVDEYIKIKTNPDIITTDKTSDYMADLEVRRRHGISLTHFINMNKAFQSVIQSFKKRLKQLEWERWN